MTTKDSCDNCYNVLKKYGLDCPKNCDYDTAKIALRNLYLKHHPDKGGDPEIFKEIRECGPMVVQDKCTDTHNIRTKCDIMTQQLRRTYTVKPTCIKSQFNKSQKGPKLIVIMEKDPSYSIISTKIINFINEQIVITVGELALNSTDTGLDISIRQIVETANNVGKLAMLHELSKFVAESKLD